MAGNCESDPVHRRSGGSRILGRLYKKQKEDEPKIAVR